MRKVLTFQFIMIITTINCFAQVKVNSNVIAAYNAVYQQLSDPSKQLFVNSNHFALCTSYQVDTLNKFQQQDFSSVNVVAVDSMGNPLPRTTSNPQIIYPAPLLFNAQIIKDTLILSATTIDIDFTSKIYRKQISSVFGTRCRDTLYRLTLDSTALPNGFEAKADLIDCTLSSNTFKAGDTLYGELNLYSPTFYAYDLGFTTQYIKQRVRWKYYFKTILK